MPIHTLVSMKIHTFIVCIGCSDQNMRFSLFQGEEISCKKR